MAKVRGLMAIRRAISLAHKLQVPIRQEVRNLAVGGAERRACLFVRVLISRYTAKAGQALIGSRLST